MSKKTVVSAPVKEAGKVNADILADYATSVGNLQGSEKEIEIAFIRACVASGVSVRDLQASIKQGQADARLAGMRVLPSITTGKVQSFARFVAMADTMPDFHLLTVKEGLNLAQASPRLPEGFTVEGKTVEEVTSAIPAREVKTDSGKTARKTTRAIPSLAQFAEMSEQVKESLPADLSELTEMDLVALASIVRTWAGLARLIKKAA